MKFIVIGATGYIGKPLFEYAKKLATTIGTSSRGDDELMSLKLDASLDFNYGVIEEGDLVLLTAAISAPDICANEHDRAWAVNVDGTAKFITNVINRGAKVIFFSSDTVYGETSDEFDEAKDTKPAGEYAQMKNALEKQFMGNPLFKAIRLSYVFSREDKFTKYLINCAEKNEEAELFHPFYRAIIHRDDLIEGIIALAQKWDGFPQQVINFGGPQLLSRVQFAEKVRDSVLPQLKFQVTEPDAAFFKNRPRIIAMASNVLPNLLGRPLKNLEEAAIVEFS